MAYKDHSKYREWVLRNAEYLREYKQKWQRANAEKHNASTKEWQKRNPDYVRDYMRNRLARNLRRRLNKLICSSQSFKS